MFLSSARVAARRVAGPSTLTHPVRALSTTAPALAKSGKKGSKAKKGVKAKKVAHNPDVLPLEEAVRVLRALEIGTPSSGFALEITTRHNKPGATPLRGRISLPSDPRRVPDTIVVFAEPDSPSGKAAREAGAHIVGGRDLFPKILSGEIQPTKCLATPAMLPLLGQNLARFLGPKGLMPAAKRSTVGEGAELGRLVKEAGGTVEWRADKLGVVRTTVARMTFATPAIVENARMFVDTVRDSATALSAAESPLARINPANQILKVCLETTQGPSIELKDVL